MLRRRLIVTSLGEKTKKATTVKDCHQGRLLSSMLWSLVVEDLLRKMHESSFTTHEYADHLVSLLAAGMARSFQLSCKLQYRCFKAGVLGRDLLSTIARGLSSLKSLS